MVNIRIVSDIAIKIAIEIVNDLKKQVTEEMNEEQVWDLLNYLINEKVSEMSGNKQTMWQLLMSYCNPWDWNQPTKVCKQFENDIWKVILIGNERED